MVGPMGYGALGSNYHDSALSQGTVAQQFSLFLTEFKMHWKSPDPVDHQKVEGAAKKMAQALDPSQQTAFVAQFNAYNTAYANSPNPENDPALNQQAQGVMHFLDS